MSSTQGELSAFDKLGIGLQQHGQDRQSSAEQLILQGLTGQANAPQNTGGGGPSQSLLAYSESQRQADFERSLTAQDKLRIGLAGPQTTQEKAWVEKLRYGGA